MSLAAFAKAFIALPAQSVVVTCSSVNVPRLLTKLFKFVATTGNLSANLEISLSPVNQVNILPALGTSLAALANEVIALQAADIDVT